MYPTALSRFSSTVHFAVPSIFVLYPTALSRFSSLQENLNAYSTPNKPSRFLRAKPYSYELYHDKTFWSISSLPPQLLLIHPLLSRQIHPSSQAKSNPLAFQDHPPQSIQQPIFRVLLKQAIFPRPLPLLQIPILFSKKTQPTSQAKSNPLAFQDHPLQSIQQPIFRILLRQVAFPRPLPLLQTLPPALARQTHPTI